MSARGDLGGGNPFRDGRAGAELARAERQPGAQAGWQIFRWPLLMAVANAVGLVAALVGDGWLDLVSWLTLGLTVVVMIAAWRGWRAGTIRADRRD